MKYSDSQIQNFVKDNLSQIEKEQIQAAMLKDTALADRVREYLIEFTALKEIERRHWMKKMKGWSEEISSPTPPEPPPLPPSIFKKLLPILATLTTIGLVIGFTVWYLQAPQEIQPSNFHPTGSEWKATYEDDIYYMDLEMVFENDSLMNIAINAILVNYPIDKVTYSGKTILVSKSNGITIKLENMEVESIDSPTNVTLEETQEKIIDIFSNISNIKLFSKEIMFEYENENAIYWQKQ